MRKSIAITALAAAIATAAIGAAVTLGPGRRHRVEPPGGTAHRGRPGGGHHGRLRLPQPGQARHGHRSWRTSIPGEDPAAGPLWYTFSPGARYNLKIDTTGDVQPDVIYRFQFQRKTGQFFLGDTAQPYTVTRIAKGRTTVVARGTTPPNNIGKRSTPELPEPRHEVDRLVRRRRLEGVRRTARRPVLRRHRRDLRPRRDPQGHGQHGRRQGLLRRLRRPHVRACRSRSPALAAKNGTIGVWASVDRRKVTTRGATTRDSGAWVQVNRLGNPLVNEVIIPTGLKDRWNALQPWSESEFRKYYTEPILAAVINKLYKLGAPETGRDDLVAVLLTGVPKLNFTGPKLADVLRLNLSDPGDEEPEPARRPRRRQPGLAERPAPRRRRDRHRRAGGGRLPQGREAAARRRRQRATTSRCSTPFPYVADPQSGFDNTKGLQK